MLDEIVEHKKLELEEAKSDKSEADLLRLIGKRNPPLNFSGALMGERTRIIAEIKKIFTVNKKGKTPYSPTLKDEISMYLSGVWYSLIAHSKKYNSTSESLDPSILSKSILSPILGITDEKTDSNISFYDGTIPLEELKNKVDRQEYSIAFILKPIDIESLKKVADHNEIMPPKSTYIKPKLRSGVTIYKLD